MASPMSYDSLLQAIKAPLTKPDPQQLRFDVRPDLFCCGVYNLGSFWLKTEATPQIPEIAGCGLYTASFNHKQKEELKLLKAHPDIEVLFESEWYYNNNSGNEVCFLVLHNKNWESEKGNGDEYPEQDDEDDDEPF